MSSILKIRKSNVAAASALSSRPVAVFVGGTAGIGAGMAKAFAQHRNGDAHIIIVGRNRQAAQEVIASFPKPAEGEPQHEFVECDVSLMKNVRKTTTELVQRLPKVNYLVLSQGIITTRADKTEEGIDKKLALHYYSRWRFAYDFIPALQKAADANEDAKVITVLDSREQPESALNPDDFGLQKNYSVPAAAKYACAANNAMVESFAEKYPKISFTHIFPGFVNTGIASSSDDWKMRWLSPVASVLGRVAGVSPETCGEYMWHGAYAGKAGWFRKDNHGEDVPPKSISPELRNKLWEHTLEITGR
ncbi:NAD(P)-binding protein [Irpex lacteus]|nr:NAD(P)-binding protein [Irpex lacteus]